METRRYQHVRETSLSACTVPPPYNPTFNKTRNNVVNSFLLLQGRPKKTSKKAKVLSDWIKSEKESLINTHRHVSLTQLQTLCCDPTEVIKAPELHRTSDTAVVRADRLMPLPCPPPWCVWDLPGPGIEPV